jgi:hypothetical protein
LRKRRRSLTRMRFSADLLLANPAYLSIGSPASAAGSGVPQYHSRHTPTRGVTATPRVSYQSANHPSTTRHR